MKDTIRYILRFTEFEIDKLNSAYKRPMKLMAKMVRFIAESIVIYDDRVFSPDVTGRFFLEESSIFGFYIALHLDRVFEQGDEIAEQYFQKLVEYEQVPDYLENSVELAEYINNVLLERPFIYRHAPIEQREVELNDAEVVG